MNLNDRLNKHIDLLIKRYPQLECVKNEIIEAYLILEECYKNNGKARV